MKVRPRPLRATFLRKENQPTSPNVQEGPREVKALLL